MKRHQLYPWIKCFLVTAVIYVALLVLALRMYRHRADPISICNQTDKQIATEEVVSAYVRAHLTNYKSLTKEILPGECTIITYRTSGDQIPIRITFQAKSRLYHLLDGTSVYLFTNSRKLLPSDK